MFFALKGLLSRGKAPIATDHYITVIRSRGFIRLVIQFCELHGLHIVSLRCSVRRSSQSLKSPTICIVLVILCVREWVVAIPVFDIPHIDIIFRRDYNLKKLFQYLIHTQFRNRKSWLKKPDTLFPIKAISKMILLMNDFQWRQVPKEYSVWLEISQGGYVVLHYGKHCGTCTCVLWREPRHTRN